MKVFVIFLIGIGLSNAFFVSTFTDAFNKVKTAAETLENKASAVVQDLKTDFNKAKAVAGAVVQTTKDFVPFAVDLTGDFLDKAKTDTKAMFVDGANTIAEKLGKRNFLDDLVNSLKTVGGAVKQTGQDFKPYAKEVGQNLLNEVKNETTSMLGGILSSVIGDAFSSLFHKTRSPLAVLEKGAKLMTELEGLLNLGNSQYSQVINEIFDEVEVIAKKVKSMEMNPQEGIKMLDDLIAKHTSLSKEFLAALERDVTQVAAQIFNQHKRDLVTGLGTVIANNFKPVVDGIGQLLNQVKESVAGQLNNIDHDEHYIV